VPRERNAKKQGAGRNEKIIYQGQRDRGLGEGSGAASSKSKSRCLRLAANAGGTTTNFRRGQGSSAGCIYLEASPHRPARKKLKIPRTASILIRKRQVRAEDSRKSRPISGGEKTLLEKLSLEGVRSQEKRYGERALKRSKSPPPQRGKKKRRWKVSSKGRGCRTTRKGLRIPERNSPRAPPSAWKQDYFWLYEESERETRGREDRKG